ncbi:MAG TPA: PH domain-containing protein [Steroidobacteraceae bacterium]|jgi:energy-coupling factor transporter transmembrane protein EcfT|nr:PH domain-containing protein [Steroidobacteraceae bacterium]
MVFRSKIDGSLKAIGVAMPCVALVAIVTSQRIATGVLWLPAILMTLVAVVIVWVNLSTYYEFEGEAFVAHSGPFRWRIPLQEIRAVSESDSARSGPALSMDRLEVAYGNGRVLLISPRDKAGFLAALRRRVPRLSQ